MERIHDYLVVGGPFNGTYGTVCIGEHTILKVKRAIKRLHDHVRTEVIKDEAKAQQTINSPYVAQIYDFWEKENAILMEYCPLGLDEYLRKRLNQEKGRIPYEEAREVLYGILQGLNDAHKAGVIHGDIKPGNVRFGVGQTDADIGLPKLGDFGASRRIREKVPGVRGSTNWMAPELIDGGISTEASDYFSYGILAYLTLTGRHPFFADDPSCLTAEEDKIKERTFLPKPLHEFREDVPLPVSSLVMELLSRDSDARIRAEKELKAALSTPMEATSQLPTAGLPISEQPTQEELNNLSNAYKAAREMFFMRYHPREAIQILDEFLKQFNWQRFLGSKASPISDCWSLLAFIENSSGSFDSAKEAATNGLAVDPDHVNSLHARAYAHTQLGNYKDAETDLKRALDLAPTPAKRRQLDRLLDTVKDRLGIAKVTVTS